ncbi:hypothetical protein [Actinoplanes sp. NPDC026670]|jgi:hypothetical protein|uniref:hypothetical protein n=1 Tax=Actinoplanes sp. NPDC026670 TaxID=3154700 RepID=UPI0033DA9568
MTKLLELRGVVEAAPDAVAAVLLDVGSGGRSPLAVTGTVEHDDGDEFVVIHEGSRMTVTVDRAGRSVSLQGEWWYRGVTSVEPDPRGSLVVHRVFNVAPGHRWAVRMVSRGPLNAAPTAFATQLEQLSRLLGAAAWVITD